MRNTGSLDRFKLLSNMQIRAAVTEIPFLVLAHLKYEIKRRKWCQHLGFQGRCYWLCYCQNWQTICVCTNMQIRRQLGKGKGKRKR